MIGYTGWANFAGPSADEDMKRHRDRLYVIAYEGDVGAAEHRAPGGVGLRSPLDPRSDMSAGTRAKWALYPTTRCRLCSVPAHFLGEQRRHDPPCEMRAAEYLRDMLRRWLNGPEQSGLALWHGALEIEPVVGHLAPDETIRHQVDAMLATVETRWARAALIQADQEVGGCRLAGYGARYEATLLRRSNEVHEAGLAGGWVWADVGYLLAGAIVNADMAVRDRRFADAVAFGENQIAIGGGIRRWT